MKYFTFPGKSLLETGRFLASFLILAQMPVVWVDPWVRLDPLFSLALRWHLSLRASPQSEVRHGRL